MTLQKHRGAFKKMSKFLLFLPSFPQNESLESCLFFRYTAVNQSFILENSPSNWRFSGLLSFWSEKTDSQEG